MVESERTLVAVKYVIVILGGVASESSANAAPGRQQATPLEAAATPNLDSIAVAGRVGRVTLGPVGLPIERHSARATLFGYARNEPMLGRAAAIAWARQLATPDKATLLAVDLLSVTGEPGDLAGDGRVLHVGESIEVAAEASVLLQDLSEEIAREIKGLYLTEPHGGVSLAIDTSGLSYARTETIPAGRLVGEAWAQYLPDGDATADRLGALIGLSHGFLTAHPINRARVEQGLPPMNMVWPSDPCHAIEIAPIAGKWDLPGSRSIEAAAAEDRCPGALITRHEPTAGFARAAGLCIVDVDARSSASASAAASIADAAITAIADHAVVIVTVEAATPHAEPDAWAHRVEAIENIDRDVIGPISGILERAETRLMIACDTITSAAKGSCIGGSVPFAMAGSRISSLVRRVMTERAADEADVAVEHGHELMEFFLRSGLRASARGASPGHR